MLQRKKEMYHYLLENVSIGQKTLRMRIFLESAIILDLPKWQIPKELIFTVLESLRG